MAQTSFFFGNGGIGSLNKNTHTIMQLSSSFETDDPGGGALNDHRDPFVPPKRPTFAKDPQNNLQQAVLL